MTKRDCASLVCMWALVSAACTSRPPAVDAPTRGHTHNRALAQPPAAEPPPRTAEPSAALAASDPSAEVLSAALGAEERAVPAEPENENTLSLPLVDDLVEQAVARDELPGCVVAIGTSEGVRYLRAHGARALEPREPMTPDTLFDLASVTKVVATTASLMRLEEQGKLDVDAPVHRYLPAFGQRGKRGVRVRHLLTHTSGLPRVNVLRAYDDGPEVAFQRLFALRLEHPVGQVFNYSDLGFLVLGKLVETVSGKPLDVFAREEVWEPLGMQRTRFHPPESEVPRTAPTELRDDEIIRGVVDDPRSYRLGGVAGNAGAFSDARDLARFARMLLRGGELDGERLFAPETVARWTAPQPAGHARRTLGFDAQSGYARGRGQLMGPRTFGHSGYTGTSLWLDPERDVFVLLLSNRVHVGTHGSIYPLASSIADLALDAMEGEQRTEPAQPEVLAGIDVLEARQFAELRGRRVALLTNGAARDRQGKRTLDVLSATPELTLATVWTPEHGLSARREGHVRGGKVGQLRVHSLFGKQRNPTPGMLHGADAIVVDLQDVGVRFYTYAATVGRVMEFAAEQDVPVFILDRPNPLGGTQVAGPITEASFTSFVNHHPLPIQHGLTLGELAVLLAAERELPLAPTVVQMQGWTRDMLFSDTGLPWRAPSPNLRKFSQVVLYPAVALVEGTNVSVGRGTRAPFELVGAPFVDADQLAEALRHAELPGVRVEPAHFRPRAARHRGKLCHGVRLTLEDPRQFDAMRTGLALVRALEELKPAWDDTRLAKMIADQATLDMLERGVPLDDVLASYQEDVDAFGSRRANVLLYPEAEPEPALEPGMTVAAGE